MQQIFMRNPHSARRDAKSKDDFYALRVAGPKTQIGANFFAPMGLK